MKTKYLIKGIVKSIPGIEYLYNFHKATGGTDNARYCYSVWMRHLLYAYENGFRFIPQKIAELGPGDSLGIGLSALISGAEKYYALDIVKFTDSEKNLKIFEELVALFKQRSSIPAESEFSALKPELTSYNFPFHIYSEEYLEKMLDERRLDRIRESIKAIDDNPIKSGDNMIQYRAPWFEDRVIDRESVGMIISQAVLQHVDDLERTYQAMYKWLGKKGIMSHEIDFKSMGSAATWDGHWAYSDMEWKLVRGRKVYLINREPYSTHVNYLEKYGFKLIFRKKCMAASSFINKNKMARRYRKLSLDDLTTSGVFVQAVK